MKPTVVILLSDKRSGSTIFQNEVCRHPAIQTVEYSTHQYLETQHWLKGAALLDMPDQTYYDRAGNRAFRNKSLARVQTIDTLTNNIPNYVPPQKDRDLVFDGWESLCHCFAKPVFFEKSPQHLAQWASLSLMLEWMEQTDFDVKIIGLVRNPLSVLYSAYELFHTQSELRQHGWADMHRNLLAFEGMISPDCYIQVKYEDLIENPVDFFNQIFKFIGVSEYSHEEHVVHSASKFRWVEDQTFTLKLHDSVKQIGRHFGYSDEEMHNPQKPGLPMPQRLLNRIGHKYSSIRHRFVNRIVKPLLMSWRQR